MRNQTNVLWAFAVFAVVGNSLGAAGERPKTFDTKGTQCAVYGFARSRGK
jgi:hypothetical protein